MFGKIDATGLTAKFVSIVRYYGTYRKMHSLLRKSQHWSKEEIETYQLQEVQKLLCHSYENVPYYHSLFDNVGLKPGDIKKLEDLEKIPYLTREIVKTHMEELKAVNYPEFAFLHGTTGGSSGTPLSFYLPAGESQAFEWAFMKTQWERVGYQFWHKSAVLRGNRPGTGLTNQNRISKKILFGRWLILSPYHLRKDTYLQYVEQLRKFKPKYIQAYPSLIYQLAQYMLQHRISAIPSVRAILCGSEGMTPFQRKQIEDAFKCRVYSWYGHSEMCVLAGECEKSTDYHIFPEYGITELIDDSGKVISSPDVAGEVVSTSLSNYVFPLIRYKTGDIGVYADGTCKCGREYKRFSKIEGRLQDIIITKDYRKVTLTSLIFAQHFKAFSHFENMQIVQNEPGILVVKIVKTDEYTTEDEAEIRTGIQKVTDNTVDTIFDYATPIVRSISGKYKFLIQNMDLDNMQVNHVDNS